MEISIRGTNNRSVLRAVGFSCSCGRTFLSSASASFFAASGGWSAEILLVCVRRHADPLAGGVLTSYGSLHGHAVFAQEMAPSARHLQLHGARHDDSVKTRASGR